MFKEIDIFGVFVSPFAIYLLLALLTFIPLRILCDYMKIDRWVWHRNLFDFAVFVIILSLIGLMF